MAKEWRVLFENLPDGVMVADTRANLVEINHAARRILAVSEPDPFPIRECAESLKVRKSDGTPLPHEEAALCRAIRGQETADCDAIISVNGEDRRLNVTGAPVLDDSSRLKTSSSTRPPTS